MKITEIKYWIKSKPELYFLVNFWHKIGWIFNKTAREFHRNLYRIAWFDLVHRTNFRGRIRHDKLGFGVEQGNDYSASPFFLTDVLQKLNITGKDRILDLGCGKGFALYCMSKFPFHKISGVELSKNMAEQCMQNMNRVCRDKMDDGTINIINGDAARFGHEKRTLEDFDQYNYYYIYNSFPYEVMDRVKTNIERSLVRNPRKVRVIYVYPAALELFCSSKFFRLERQMYPNRQSGGVYVFKTVNKRISNEKKR